MPEEFQMNIMSLMTMVFDNYDENNFDKRMEAKLGKVFQNKKDEGKLTNTPTQASVSKPTSGSESSKSTPQEVHHLPLLPHHHRRYAGGLGFKIKIEAKVMVIQSN